jgi:hypothetical protein
MNPNLILKGGMPRVILTGLLLLMTSGPLLAQDTKKALVNSDIVEMMKAGFPESTIILTIQKGPSQFDTTPQALIQLKNGGVSTAVIDAMIRAGSPTPAPASEQTTVSARKANPLDPMGATAATVPVASGVILIDGDNRTVMKYSSPEARTNSMLGAVVNPFHKTRIRTALNGNHAQLRTKNTSPAFEVGGLGDANPSDMVALVKLKTKFETREIEVGRGGITGTSTGFRKEDLVAVSIEELPDSVNQSHKTYRVRTVSPLPPGEYALVYAGAVYYDFGIDAN